MNIVFFEVLKYILITHSNDRPGLTNDTVNKSRRNDVSVLNQNLLCYRKYTLASLISSSHINVYILHFSTTLSCLALLNSALNFIPY